MVQAGRQQFPQRLERVGYPALDDVEHHRLGPVQGAHDVLGEGVAHLRYFAGDTDQPAQQGMLFDDPGIAGRIGDGRRVGLERDQVAHAARRPPGGRPASARRPRSQGRPARPGHTASRPLQKCGRVTGGRNPPPYSTRQPRLWRPATAASPPTGTPPPGGHGAAPGRPGTGRSERAHGCQRSIGPRLSSFPAPACASLGAKPVLH